MHICVDAHMDAKTPYKRDLYSAKETYNFKELTNRSHPITHICVDAYIDACT